jgi:chorismate mutase
VHHRSHRTAQLQALSKRIHWGAFVAEAKFSASPEQYTPAIEADDGDALMAMLTFPDQEARVVARVRNKAATFGQDMDEDGCVACSPGCCHSSACFQFLGGVLTVCWLLKRVQCPS